MRIRIYSLFLIIAAVTLVAGLFRIQVGLHDKYRTMSEENRLKVVPLMAPRGTIMDRNGIPMVKDSLSFNAAVIYSRVEDKEELSDTLAGVLEAPREEMLDRINESRRIPYSPCVIEENIGIDRAIHLEEAAQASPGVFLDVSVRRRYLYGTTAGNLIGYLGYINRSEFKKLRPYGYGINDQIGRDGIEKQYDEYLRGRHGGKQVEVDHRGRRVATLGYKEPTPGKNLVLTIDLELQKFCEDLLKGNKGAIVVMDPRKGGVLAMASSPGYDPEMFVDRKRRGEVSDVLKDGESPLLNRAIRGLYPPGSVFKTVLAAGALEEGVITPSTSFECRGAMIMGRRAFHCWKKTGHGIQYLVDAIKNSCNVYFWRVGLELGVEDLARYASKFGIGRTTGIDLPLEASGILPSASWKKRNMKEAWYKGETMNYSVGQGYLLVTPLQIARVMSVFANGGYLVRPYVVSLVGGVALNSPVRTPVGISEKNIGHVRQGLKQVVNGKRGTGVKARQRDFIVAGKTGTSQTGTGKDHGWFAGFAPFDDPGITVVVFDEFGGKGGYYAAGTAGKVFARARELGII